MKNAGDEYEKKKRKMKRGGREKEREGPCHCIKIKEAKVEHDCKSGSGTAPSDGS